MMLPIVLFTLTRLDTATTSGGTLRPSNRRECLSLATQECRSQHNAIDFHGEGKEGIVSEYGMVPMVMRR